VLKEENLSNKSLWDLLLINSCHIPLLALQRSKIGTLNSGIALILSTWNHGHQLMQLTIANSIWWGSFWMLGKLEVRYRTDLDNLSVGLQGLPDRKDSRL